IVPFWLIWAMAGWRGMLQVWPACLTTGASFALAQFIISNYHGPWVVDIAGAAISILALVALLKFWQPKTIWRFDHDTPADASTPVTRAQAARAWMPWIILSVIVFVWGLPVVKNTLNHVAVTTQVPML